MNRVQSFFSLKPNLNFHFSFSSQQAAYVTIKWTNASTRPCICGPTGLILFTCKNALLKHQEIYLTLHRKTDIMFISGSLLHFEVSDLNSVFHFFHHIDIYKHTEKQWLVHSLYGIFKTSTLFFVFLNINFKDVKFGTVHSGSHLVQTDLKN